MLHLFSQSVGMHSWEMPIPGSQLWQVCLLMGANHRHCRGLTDDASLQHNKMPTF